MRFITGARFRSGTIVIRGTEQGRDPITNRQYVVRPPLKIDVKEHQFDTDLLAKKYKWTEEEQKAVEAALLDHHLYERADGSGFFVDNSITQFKPLSEKEYVAENNLSFRCIAREQNGEDVTQCEELAAGESEYCAKHTAMLAASNQS